MTRRIAPLLLLLTLIAALPACRGIARIFKSPAPIVLPATIPEDFKFTVTVRDAKDPDVDYTLRIMNRLGEAKYDIQFRAPVRRRKPGDLTLDEVALDRLWTAIRETRFQDMDEVYDESTHPVARNAGMRTFYVRSGNLEKKVEAKYVMPPAVRQLAIAAIQAFPSDLLKPVGDGRGTETDGSQDGPSTYLGDLSTKVFHSSDCPLLEKLAEHNRQPFPSVYEALNFKYSPCRECNPLYVSED